MDLAELFIYNTIVMFPIATRNRGSRKSPKNIVRMIISRADKKIRRNHFQTPQARSQTSVPIIIVCFVTKQMKLLYKI